MQLVDANVLLYAVNEDAPHHESARTWLDGTLAGQEALGFAWVVLLAFLRLSTRAGLWAHPLQLEDAARLVELWLAQPPAVVVHPTQRHLSLMRGLLGEVGTAANLVNDAHLAALALEQGAEVVSYDGDFERFEGIRLRRPGQADSS